MQIESEGVYLDTSALAKLFVSEPDSNEVESALLGRTDLFVSELSMTELASALARRVREGDLAANAARSIHRKARQLVTSGAFQRVDLDPSTHQEAERMLLRLGLRVPLRAIDALHLALARQCRAAAFVTFDRSLRSAAEESGSFEVP